MSIIGTVFETQDVEIAGIEVEETGDYKVVKVLVGGNTVIRFPLDKTVDTNTIALRASNIINQTGLVDNPVRCDVTEVP